MRIHVLPRLVLTFLYAVRLGPVRHPRPDVRKRQADLLRIDQQLDRHQHLTEAEVVQHGELMDYLVRVAGR